MQLGEIVSAQMGTITKRAEANPSDVPGTRNVRVLLPKAIENGLVISDNLESICVKEDDKRLKLTARGDIVLKLTPPYDSAYVTEDGLLVPSYCVLIRPMRNDVDARFLSGFLNTAWARDQLAHTINSAYGMIKMRDIQELEIPLPSFEKQTALGEAYYLLCRKRALLKELIAVENKIADSIITKAIAEVAGNEI